MDIDDDLLVHSVTVEPLTGRGPYGEQYGPPAEVAGFLSDVRQLVRNVHGDEVISESTFITTLDQAPVFPTDSKVTLPSGQVAYVIKASRHDDGGLGAPSHLEVSIT